MRTSFTLWPVFVVGALLGSVARGAILDFDDIPLGPPEVLDGYHGLGWDNFHRQAVPPLGSGYEYGLVSGRNTLFNVGGLDARIFGDPFDFESAYLTAAWRLDLNVSIEGFLDDEKLYAAIVILDFDAPTFVELDFRGIDELRFSSFGGTSPGLIGDGTHFVMDDLSITSPGSPPVAPIPEPTSSLLFAAGCLLVCSRLRGVDFR